MENSRSTILSPHFRQRLTYEGTACAWTRGKDAPPLRFIIMLALHCREGSTNDHRAPFFGAGRCHPFASSEARAMRCVDFARCR
jgi:hypothetical protein